MKTRVTLQQPLPAVKPKKGNTQENEMEDYIIRRLIVTNIFFIYGNENKSSFSSIEFFYILCFL